MSENGLASSQSRYVNYWVLGRQNLFDFEKAASGKGNAVSGLEGSGTIFMVNEINELTVEKVRSQSHPLRHLSPIALYGATLSPINAVAPNRNVSRR